jgi:uncharacterized membrane protein YccF (DUF307 family)
MTMFSLWFSRLGLVIILMMLFCAVVDTAEITTLVPVAKASIVLMAVLVIPIGLISVRHDWNRMIKEARSEKPKKGDMR